MLIQLAVLLLSSLSAQAQRVEVPDNTPPVKMEQERPQKPSLGQQARQRSMEGGNERVVSLRQVQIGFGPAFFKNLNSDSTGLDFNLGYNWGVNDHFDLGLQTEFAISSEPVKAYLFTGKMVMNYYFLAEDISPFVGAGFGYGWSQARNNTNLADTRASGFAMSAQAGMKFFRTSDVNLAVALAYTTIFDDNSLGQPGVFALQVTLLY